MITLYPDQKKLISTAQELFRQKHKHIIFQAPTGAGKTIMFSWMVSEALSKGKRVLILTHRNELLKETGGTLEEFGIRPFLLTAKTGYPPPSFHRCVVGMAQTIKSRVKNVKKSKDWIAFLNTFDLIIIDEAHLCEADALLDLMLWENKYIIGATATPKRTGKQPQLARHYTHIALGPTTMELIDLGRLVPDRYFSIQGVDLDGVKTKESKDGKDFDNSSIYQRFNKPQLYGGVVKSWFEHTPWTITIGFCLNIQHCIQTAKAFRDAGVSVRILTSDLQPPKPKEDGTEGDKSKYEIKKAEYDIWEQADKEFGGTREEVLEAFHGGKCYIMLNVGIATTGYNFRPIETVLCNMATLSDNLILQIWGRGSRTYEGAHPITGEWFKKEWFNILDFGDHKKRLGGYRDKRDYSLIYDEPKGGGTPVFKECGKLKGRDKADKQGRPGCGRYMLASQMICPSCGYVFEVERNVKEGVMVEEHYEPRELTETDKLEKYAQERGYKAQWVVHQVIAKDGMQGLENYARDKKYSSGWLWRAKTQYKRDLDEWEAKQKMNTA